jgi:ring-1,2-phenylacetyl-CoA epoxidase subunit PaaD
VSEAAALDAVWEVLRGVADPEIPVLSLVDLGVIRSVTVEGDVVTVGLSPTYSGCPATSVIREDVAAALDRAGYVPQVREVLSPPWTSAWITSEGCEKLRAYGIAPPEFPVTRVSALHTPMKNPACPLCASRDTELISEFGSTPCKSLHRCRTCLEPFDCFKCI